MPGQRRSRILGLFRNPTGTSVGTKQLCHVCAEATATSGAGIMLMNRNIPHGSVCTTDRVSERIEQLQYELGEGPCVDAHNTGSSVAEPNLANPAVVRWAAFSGPAVVAGAAAVFGFPLRVGAISFGAMNLYRNKPGHLSDDQHANALVMADIAAHAVLLLQADAASDVIADELVAAADFHYVVHQAAGMVAAQLHVPVGQAHVRLRAYAFGNQRNLTDVATDIINRTLRFAPDDSAPDPSPRNDNPTSD